MKNFIFISPNFPSNYWKFCKQLQYNGYRVLGIGDCPYEKLSDDVWRSLNEYYWVQDLEKFEDVYRAVAFFIFKYGKIDYIESNNEYWLERDAALRTAFNIKTGFQERDIKKIKFKSQMKKYFEKAGVKTARYYLVKSLKGCKKFVEEVGYPVIVKPDNGVGANDTRKIENQAQLEEFFEKMPAVQYIMEEYIYGEVNSYDAIIGADGNPLFETGNVTPGSLMDVVNNGGESLFYIVNEPFEDVRQAGRATVKAFNVKNRFVHFEFFRLLKDQPMGRKGDVVALEVNMRPSGGISPDMMNYANSTDVYKIWADMIAYGKTEKGCGERYFCGFAGRRDNKVYYYSEQELKTKYSADLKIVERVPKALSGAMGDFMFVAAFRTKQQLDEFFADVIKVI